MIPQTTFISVTSLLALLGAGTAGAASAQTIQGQRVDSITGSPVPGGFVVLTDPEGNEVARSLVGSDGRFTVRTSARGTYRLRSERIGYRATVSPAIELAEGESLAYAFRVSPIPVQLAAIEVRDERRCDIHPADDAATAVVWEEVRKALEAARWTARQNYRVRILRYERELDARRRRVEAEETSSKAGPMSRSPFTSIPADDLAASGFVVQERGDSWYYAPDAEVLLADAFLDTHCFRVVRGDTGRRELLGLAFEPTPDRRLPDVEGALWIDRESAELRVLEYRYTNLPWDVRDDRVGGTVEFLQLPSGMWVVREWQIRIPRIVLEGPSDPYLDRRPDARVTGFHDTGGEVFEVSAHRGIPVFKAPLASIFGTVEDHTGEPMGGARVRLTGTDFVTIADATGEFVVEAPLEGEYRLTLEHPRLDSIGLRQIEHPLTLKRGRIQQLTLEVPHPDSVLAQLCPDHAPPPGVGARAGPRALYGVVRRRSDGRPAHNTTVSAVWQRLIVSSTTVGANKTSHTAFTDGSGFYTICGLPVGRPIVVQAQREELESPTARVLFPLADAAQLMLVWDKPPGSFYEEIHSAPFQGWKLDLELIPAAERAATRAAALSGVVVDAITAEPVVGIQVMVNGEDSTNTQADGTFAIPDLRWNLGLNRVVFRRLGYRQGAYDVHVGRADSNVVLNIALQPSPVAMEEMVIEGERTMIPTNLRGFYERRERGAGTFLARKQIEQRMGARLTDILRTIPGVELKGQYQDALFLSRSNPRCKMTYKPPIVFIDGLVLGGLLSGQEVTGLMNSLNPEDVIAIEVYQGVSEIPPEFNRTEAQCGVIVLWTK